MSRMRDLLIKRRSEVTPLIHWDFSGKSNADADTIVEDLTGNGYNLELKNFAFDNVSGYNGYPTDFRKWTIVDNENYDDNLPIYTYENKVLYNGTLEQGKYVAGLYSNFKFSSENTVLKVSGLKESQYIRFFNYTSSEGSIIITVYNGINIIDTKHYNQADNYYLNVYPGTDTTFDNVTVEIFPLYPDQLVFRDTALGKTIKHPYFQNNRGFTFIAERQYIDTTKRNILFGKFINPDNPSVGYIIFEDSDTGIHLNNWRNFTFGQNTIINNFDTGRIITYGTSKSYRGIQELNKGTDLDKNEKPFYIGSYFNNATSGNANFAIKEVYIFDRDLTQSQIEKFISDNMIPLPEVYYDVAKQGTLNDDTTKDKLIDFSGNDHHGTLHNFSFDETNGWGYYNNISYDFNNLNSAKWKGTKIDNKTFKFEILAIDASFVTYLDVTDVPGTYRLYSDKSFVRLSKSDASFASSSLKDTVVFDGVDYIDYTITQEDLNSGHNKILISLDTNKVNIGDEFIIKVLPTDADCLRFKGTADETNTYVDLSMTEGFKTVFLLTDADDTEYSSRNYYDQRYSITQGGNHFAITSGQNINSIAYQERNDGKTYINGELNTTIDSKTLTGKRCITIVDDAVNSSNSQGGVINAQVLYTVKDYGLNQKLYKFLGFKEALSEKQIKMVIEKYGLQVD